MNGVQISYTDFFLRYDNNELIKYGHPVVWISDELLWFYYGNDCGFFSHARIFLLLLLL